LTQPISVLYGNKLQERNKLIPPSRNASNSCNFKRFACCMRSTKRDGAQSAWFWRQCLIRQKNNSAVDTRSEDESSLITPFQSSGDSLTPRRSMHHMQRAKCSTQETIALFVFWGLMRAQRRIYQKFTLLMAITGRFALSVKLTAPKPGNLAPAY
jgi:hypothetical protein